MRVLIDWVANNMVKNDPYASALNTVIAKATADEDERYSIITACLEPQFQGKYF